MVQAYASTFSHDDLIVRSFYEDVESVMSKVKTQCAILTGDLSAKLDKNQAGYQPMGKYGIGSGNSGGELTECSHFYGL